MADHSDHDHTDDGGVHVHIHTTKFYAGILGALLVLTVLTVAASYVDIDGILALGRPVQGVGAWNLGLALLIGTMKASLVVLFFMHLKEDKRFNALFFVGSILFVGVFFAYTMNDTGTRGLTGDRYNGVHIDPDTGIRAPGGITGEITGEILEQGLAPAVPDGAVLFQGVCAACHSIGSGIVVGPDLAGVTTRRTEEWLIAWIASSSTVIASGDETAVALFAEFDESPMPDAPYSEAQIRAVLEYIATQSGDAAGAAGDTGGGAQIDDIVDEILGDDVGEPAFDGEGEEAGADGFIDDILGDDGAAEGADDLEAPLEEPPVE